LDKKFEHLLGCAFFENLLQEDYGAEAAITTKVGICKKIITVNSGDSRSGNEVEINNNKRKRSRSKLRRTIQIRTHEISEQGLNNSNYYKRLQNKNEEKHKNYKFIHRHTNCLLGSF